MSDSQRASRRGEAGFDLEVGAAAGRQRALGGDAAAGDEERARMAGLGGRRDDAALDRAQPREPLELAADALERLRSGRAAARRPRSGARPTSSPSRRRSRGSAARRTLELVRRQRARRELRAPPRADRARQLVWRLRRRDDAVAALAQPDVAVGPRDARVRRRPQLADQPQLLERRLELGAEHAPLDPLDRAERRLDRGPLPLASGSTSAAARAGRAPGRRRAAASLRSWKR